MSRFVSLLLALACLFSILNSCGAQETAPLREGLALSAAAEQPARSAPVIDYVLNTNTGKFHYPDCSSVDQIKPEHWLDFSGNREDVIARGYQPCKKCNP